MIKSATGLDSENNAQLSKTAMLKRQSPKEPQMAGTKSNGSKPNIVAGKPTPAQKLYLNEGLAQAGGKLPLFDKQGQLIKAKTIQACVAKGWAEPWFNNPSKPDWLVCKLTEAGRAALR